MAWFNSPQKVCLTPASNSPQKLLTPVSKQPLTPRTPRTRCPRDDEEETPFLEKEVTDEEAEEVDGPEWCMRPDQVSKADATLSGTQPVHEKILAGVQPQKTSNRGGKRQCALEVSLV